MNKPELTRTTLKKLLIVVTVTSLLLGGFVGYVYAQSSTDFTLSQGIYPGAPSFTVWNESSTYYSKSAYGLVTSGTNANLIIQNTIDNGDHTLLKDGWYSLDVGLTVQKSDFILEGEGTSTVITTSQAGITLIAFGDPTSVTPYENVGIRNLKITSDVNKSGGAGVLFRAIQDKDALRPSASFIENVLIEYQYTGLEVIGTTGLYADRVTVLYSENTGIKVHSDNNDQLHFTDVVIDGDDTEGGSESANAGFQISQTYHVYLTSVSIVRSSIGLYISQTGSEDSGQIFVTGSTISDNKDMGFQIWLRDTSSLIGVYVSTTDFSTNGVLYAPHSAARGVTISNSGTGVLEGIYFDGCDFYQNGGHGAFIGSGVGITLPKDITFSDSHFINNGKFASSTYSGLYVSANITDFSVSNSEFFNGYRGSIKTQAYGVYIETGTSDNYTITYNTFIGNNLGAVFDGGTGTNKTVFENLGYPTDLDMLQQSILNATFDMGTAFPSSPVEGQYFWRSDLDALYVYNSTNQWQQLGGSVSSADTRLGTAGENLNEGEVVYLDGDGTYKKADANSSTTMYAVAVTLENITSGNTGTLLLRGSYTNSSFSLTIGSESPIYVSSAAGAITQSVPNSSGDQVQIIGYATASDTVYFDFDSTVVEIS